MLGSFTVTLMAVFLAGPPTLSSDTLPVLLHDTFAADSRPKYKINGDVTWRKGALLLKDGAALRGVPMGSYARLDATVRWPKGTRDGVLQFYLFASQGKAAVGLGLDEGRRVLILESQRLEDTLTLQSRTPVVAAGKDTVWHLRVEVKYGLVRARAWPEGQPEPTHWQVGQFNGSLYGQPEYVLIQTGDNGGGELLELKVSATAPWRPTALQNEHGREAGSRSRKAQELSQAGRFSEAADEEGEALRSFQRAVPAFHPALVMSRLNRIRTLQSAGRLKEAADELPLARADLEATLPYAHPLTAAMYTSLGLQAMHEGRYHDARAEHLNALTIRRAVLPQSDPDLAESLNNMAALMAHWGRPEEARPMYEEALAITRKFGRKTDLPAALFNLGGTFRDLGQTARTEALYREGVEAMRKAFPEAHPRQAYALTKLGNLLLELGRLEEGRPMLEKAVALSRKALPAGHPSLANQLQALAGYHSDVGEVKRAVELTEEALSILEKRRESKQEAAFLRMNLGVLLREAGRPREAKAHAEAGLRGLREALPAEHPHVLTACYNLGRLLCQDGEVDAGWRLLREAAVARAAHVTRVAVAGPQREHAALSAQHRAVFDGLFEVAQRAGELSDRQRRDLLEAVLVSKGISGGVVGQRHEAALLAGAPGAEAALKQLREARRDLASALLSDPEGIGARASAERRKSLEDEVDRLERQLAGLAGGYRTMQAARKAGADEVVARLAPEEALIELVRHTDRYSALVVTRGPGPKPEPAVRLVSLGLVGPLDRAIGAWRGAVRRGPVPEAIEGDLRRLLWSPLAKVLPGKTTGLIVSPDGGLALVPFEAIRLEDGRYLVERMAVRYVSSGRDLLPPPAAVSRGKGKALVLGDPAYDEGAGTRSLASPATGVSPVPAGLSFKPLAGFSREVATVTKILSDRPDWEVRSAVGAEATEETLFAVERPRLLHLVTHGFFLKDAPKPAVRGLRGLELVPAKAPPVPLLTGADPRLRSGLALAGANRGRERALRGLSDGILTALEVEGLDLWGTELVVLSACETGLGEVEIGEGVLGLRRAFQLAGARAVLASLWMVPDAETERLMTDVLRAWIKGKAPHEALREGQLAMIRHLRATGDATRRTAPPLYWAGFVVHGGSK